MEISQKIIVKVQDRDYRDVNQVVEVVGKENKMLGKF